MPGAKGHVHCPGEVRAGVGVRKSARASALVRACVRVCDRMRAGACAHVLFACALAQCSVCVRAWTPRSSCVRASA